MLRRVGVEERRRFSEAGWAYGDPSYYGDGLLEVYGGQLKSVLATLGWDLEAEFYYQYLEEEPGNAGVLSDLIRPDGQPVSARDYAPETSWTEEVLVVQFGGPEHELARLIRSLHRVQGELVFYRLDPASEDAQRLEGERPGHRTRYLILPAEMGGWHYTVHDELFESLIKAWEVDSGLRAPEAKSQDRNSPGALRRKHLRGKRLRGKRLRQQRITARTRRTPRKGHRWCCSSRHTAYPAPS